MNRRAAIVRETAISFAINVALSLAFFAALFGVSAPVAAGRIATDFFPQSFMVALMGSLVPGLLLRRPLGVAMRPVILRALGFGIVAAVMGGTAAWLLCGAVDDTLLSPMKAMAIKGAYGGVLALVVTPLALTMLFRSAERKPA